MKDFLDLCAQRYSVRKYKDTPIPQEVLKYIQACTRLAPSAVNRQPWKFYLIREASTLELLYPCYDRTWFREAPVCVVACKLTAEEWKREADQKPHGDIDVAIAVEHLCLAPQKRASAHAGSATLTSRFAAKPLTCLTVSSLLRSSRWVILRMKTHQPKSGKKSRKLG